MRERSAEINLSSDKTKERERESACGNSEGIRFEGRERECAAVRESEEI